MAGTLCNPWQLFFPPGTTRPSVMEEELLEAVDRRDHFLVVASSVFSYPGRLWRRRTA